MGLLNRILTIFKIKANKAVDAIEDPRQTLDFSYEKQLDLLRDVKRGIVEVTASKRRLQLQAQELRAGQSKLDEQARAAMGAGREDLARAAIERKQLAISQLSSYEAQTAQLEGEQQRLVTAEQRLTAKVEAFRTQKEMIKAQYTAAKAQARIGESLSGISEEMADIGYAIQRAEDKTAQLRGRADAIDELMDAGVLADRLDTGSPLDRELSQIQASSAVELEMAALRKQVGPGPDVKQLESGT